MPRFRQFGALTLASIAWLGAGPVAAGEWAQCGNRLQIPDRPALAKLAREEKPPSPGALELSSDTADLAEGGISRLQGNVLLKDGARLLAADRATYDQPNDRLTASGKVRLWDDGLYFVGAEADVDFLNDRIDLARIEFIDLDSHSRGGARRLVRSGSELIEIEQGTYSTCNPDQPDWVIQARRIKLDRVADVGTARDVTVRFKNVPIFYSPYLTFPLSDKRKTGFLTPTFRLSGEAGAEVRIPFYFNLAPNYDATVRARLTSERGPVLGGEFRYLSTRGAGTLEAEYLPHDIRRGDSRALVKFRHRGEFTRGWYADLNYDWVSDREYFEDLGDSLRVSSTTHLRQRALVSHGSRYWWFSGTVENFQTVDRTLPGSSRPYKRLPRLAAGAQLPWRNRSLNAQVRTEFVRFEREDSVTGDRIEVEPALSFPVRRAGWFVEPRAALRYTAYSLDGVARGANDDPSRLLPILSFDSGLFFERFVSIRGGAYRHTLEPRLFYLYIPPENQDDLPLFDTGLFSFNFNQLFRVNRFSGTDRLGDAHQLTAALTSRLLNSDTGAEVLRVSVGQIRFLRQQALTLNPGDTIRKRDGSDFVAELSATPGRSLTILGGLQWDPDKGRTDKSALSLRYQPDAQRVLNMAYRFVRDTAEQTDISFHWPWSFNLSVVGRMNYSLDDGRILESFAGVEYESCCWAVRAVARRFLTNADGDYNNALLLQLQLKGLAGIGKRAETLVRRSIPGYQNDF